MQYKNNKKEKSIFAKTIEESKSQISIDWAIRNSKSVINDVIEAKPELKSNINELKAIKRYNRGFIDRNTLTNDYVDYSANLLRLFYKTYKAIKIVGNTQYYAASQYYCQVGEIQWLSYKNGPNMCTGGTAIAESSHNETTHSKDNAFNNIEINDIGWSTSVKTLSVETWICYIRQTAIPIYCIRMYPSTVNSHLNFKNFKILASNNTTNGIDGTWDTLLTNQNTYYVNNWSEHYITNQTLNNSIIAKGGNTVTKITDNGINYAVHTFTSSGNFELISNSAEVEYLVVAGGGGGGVNGGGGGGGGTVIKINKQLINKNIYAVIIGSGGGGGVSTTNYVSGDGSNGGNSSFNNIIATGGGGGGAYHASDFNVSRGKSGGNSGGSGGLPNTTTNNGIKTILPSNINGIVYNGNHGSQSFGGHTAGGGGGAGNSASNTLASDRSGGDGIQINMNGNYYFGGGGGGGTWQETANRNGGNGGGGGGATYTGGGTSVGGTSINNGGNGRTGQNLENTGHGGQNSGGGGGGGTFYGASGARGGNGGSGIVIIRYRIP